MQESNPSINLKEDSHKYKILTLTTKITGSNNYFSLISLIINGPKSPRKRHRLTDWLYKQDQTFCFIQETHLRENDKHYHRVKDWKTIFQANCHRPSGSLHGTSLWGRWTTHQRVTDRTTQEIV
jgi:exonuclease III